MTNEEILAAFIRPEAFPGEAIALAEVRREEIAPFLVAEIEDWAREWKDVKGYYYLVDIAAHLLAEWRDSRGFKPLLALLASPNHEILGDSLAESVPDLLTRLYDGDSAALKALVRDTSADEIVRNSVFDAYTMLVKEGVIPREEAHAFLLQLFDTLPHATNYVWTGWAEAVSDLLFEDLVPHVERLFEEEAIDITWMDYEDFEGDLADARAGAVVPGLNPGTRRRDVSPIERMQRWRYVEPGEVDEADESGDDDADDDELAGYLADHEPIVNPQSPRRPQRSLPLREWEEIQEMLPGEGGRRFDVRGTDAFHSIGRSRQAANSMGGGPTVESTVGTSLAQSKSSARSSAARRACALALGYDPET
jgi:hypothetical protein